MLETEMCMYKKIQDSQRNPQKRLIQQGLCICPPGGLFVTWVSVSAQSWVTVSEGCHFLEELQTNISTRTP